jgi:hypothetical protein
MQASTFITDVFQAAIHNNSHRGGSLCIVLSAAEAFKRAYESYEECGDVVRADTYLQAANALESVAIDIERRNERALAELREARR